MKRFYGAMLMVVGLMIVSTVATADGMEFEAELSAAQAVPESVPGFITQGHVDVQFDEGGRRRLPQGFAVVGATSACSSSMSDSKQNASHWTS